MGDSQLFARPAPETEVDLLAMVQKHPEGQPAVMAMVHAFGPIVGNINDSIHRIEGSIHRIDDSIHRIDDSIHELALEQRAMLAMVRSSYILSGYFFRVTLIRVHKDDVC